MPSTRQIDESLFMSFAEFEAMREKYFPQKNKKGEPAVQFTVAKIPHKVDDVGNVLESAFEVTLRNEEGRPLPIKTFVFHQSEEANMHKFLRRRFKDYCQG